MLTKIQILAFLDKSKVYYSENDAVLIEWLPLERKNKNKSGIYYNHISPLNFGSEFDFKFFEDLISEINSSEVCYSQIDSVKKIQLLMSQNKSYVELFRLNLKNIEHYFLNYSQRKLDLSIINVGGIKYQIDPDHHFNFPPNFNENEDPDIAERKDIIEKNLNQELEKRVHLESFLEPFRELFRNQQRKEFSGLMMLHRDKFVRLNPERSTKKQDRFFAITSELPHELYGLATKAVVGSKKEILTDVDIFNGAKDMLLKF